MRRSDPDVVHLAELALPDSPASDQQIVQALGPFISEARAARIEAVLSARTRRVAVVLDHVHDPHNGGAVLRSCDAFGIQELFAVEQGEPFAVARRATKSTHKWVDVHRFPDPESCLGALRERAMSLFVADAAGTTSLAELRARVAEGQRIGLCFGNEHDGVGDRLRAGAEGSFCVPMVGFVESLNVSVAVGVSLHAIRAGMPGDLSDDERMRLRARFYRLSVREADAIVRESVRP